MALRVELDMFSGRPNPTWELTEGERRVLEGRLLRAHRKAAPPTLPGLGYRGFIVHTDPAVRVLGGVLMWRTKTLKEESSPDEVGLEHWLLETGRPHLERGVYRAALATFQRR